MADNNASIFRKMKQLTINQALTEWIEYGEKIKHWSQDSMTHLGIMVPVWRKSIGEIKLKHFSPHNTIQLVDDIRQKKWSPSFVNANRSRYKSFIHWAMSEKLYLENDVSLPWKIIRHQKKRIKVQLTPFQVSILCMWAQKIGYPEYCRYIRFSVAMGWRLGTVLRMTWKNVEMDSSGWYYILDKQKNFEARRIPLSPDAIAALGAPGAPEERCFNLLPDHAHRFTLWKALRTIAKKAGIKHVHPHTFRYSFASTYLQNGIDAKTVAFLGMWKSVEVLMKFYAMPASDQGIRDIYARIEGKASPSA